MTDATLISIDGDPIDAQDLIFNAYVEDELNADERAEFEARLESDATFAREFRLFESMMNGLGSLAPVFAPDDFAERVQDRIRERSAGRFFDPMGRGPRMFYEVAAAAMLAIMASTYLIATAPKDAHIGDMVVQAEAPVLRPNGLK